MNFSDLKTRLADWMGAANAVRFPQTVRGDLINIALRELCRLYDTRYNETSDTLATVAGTASYTLPATWSRPYELWYLHPTSGDRVVVDFLLKQEFTRNYPDPTDRDLPAHFTVWGTSLYLGPTPDRVLTINRDYYAILAELSADGDTNAFTTNAWEAVLFRALADASRYGIEDARVPMWKDRAQELADQLVIEHTRARSTGRRAESQEPG